MKVRLIAHTIVLPETMKEETEGIWEPEDASDYHIGHSSDLAQFAGRECYQSWKRPNPDTATNQGYLANIISQGHLSTFEHGSCSFRISGVSRSLTHELIRHRHFSISQLSQRYAAVKKERSDGQKAFVVAPLFEGEADWMGTQSILQEAWDHAVEAYDRLVAMWLPRLIQQGADPHMARKRAREAARSVLPNMTPTSLVFTGNHRAWRWLLFMRGSIFADAEIRRLALALFEELRMIEPALYQDFQVRTIEGEECLVQVPIEGR